MLMLRWAALLLLLLVEAVAGQWPFDDLPPENAVRICVSFQDGTPLTRGLFVGWDRTGRIRSADLDPKTGEAVIPDLAGPCSVAFLGFGSGALLGEVPEGDVGPLLLLMPCSGTRSFRVKVNDGHPKERLRFGLHWGTPESEAFRGLVSRVRTAGLRGVRHLRRGQLRKAMPTGAWRAARSFEGGRTESVVHVGSEGSLRLPMCPDLGEFELRIDDEYCPAKGSREARGGDLLLALRGVRPLSLEDHIVGDELLLVRGPRVSGRVISPEDGEPIPVCRVRFVKDCPVESLRADNMFLSMRGQYAEPWTRSPTITDAQGRFAFIVRSPFVQDPAGLLLLRAGGGGRDVIPLRFPGGEDLDLGDLTLRRPDEIRCRFEDEAGWPLRGVKARAIGDVADPASSSGFRGRLNVELPRGLGRPKVRFWSGSWKFSFEPFDRPPPPPGTKTWRIVIPKERITRLSEKKR